VGLPKQAKPAFLEEAPKGMGALSKWKSLPADFFLLFPVHTKGLKILRPQLQRLAVKRMLPVPRYSDLSFANKKCQVKESLST
jgi:hypothetical protein